MFKVDLNCDLGESFGRYSLGCDEQVIPLISSANIACGFHASDPVVMANTVKMAKEAGIGIGAHPGFPDLMGFGRRPMKISPDEAKNYITYQLGALYGFCKSSSVEISHVKPHGAFYNMASVDYNLARGICEGVAAFDSELILLGRAGSELLNAAKDVGLKCASEYFTDRNYEDDGTLVSRNKDNAMITDENQAIERTIRAIKEGKVKSVSGKDIDIHVDSVCVHGDGVKALKFVELIRQRLIQENIEICSLRDL